MDNELENLEEDFIVECLKEGVADFEEDRIQFSLLTTNNHRNSETRGQTRAAYLVLEKAFKDSSFKLSDLSYYDNEHMCNIFEANRIKPIEYTNLEALLPARSDRKY